MLRPCPEARAAPNRCAVAPYPPPPPHCCWIAPPGGLCWRKEHSGGLPADPSRAVLGGNGFVAWIRCLAGQIRAVLRRPGSNGSGGGAMGRRPRGSLQRITSQLRPRKRMSASPWRRPSSTRKSPRLRLQASLRQASPSTEPGAAVSANRRLQRAGFSKHNINSICREAVGCRKHNPAKQAQVATLVEVLPNRLTVDVLEQLHPSKQALDLRAL